MFQLFTGQANFGRIPNILLIPLHPWATSRIKGIFPDLAVAHMTLMDDRRATGLSSLEKCLQVLLPFARVGVVLAHMVDQ